MILFNITKEFPVGTIGLGIFPVGPFLSIESIGIEWSGIRMGNAQSIFYTFIQLQNQAHKPPSHSQMLLVYV